MYSVLIQLLIYQNQESVLFLPLSAPDPLAINNLSNPDSSESAHLLLQ